MQDDFRPQPQPAQTGQAGNVGSWQPNRPDVVTSGDGRTITPPSEPVSRPVIAMPTRETQESQPAPPQGVISPVGNEAPQPQPPEPASPPQSFQPAVPTEPTPAPADSAFPSNPTLADDVTDQPKKKGSLRTFIVTICLFIFFTALFFLPILPGTVWLNAPLSSTSADVGGSIKDCNGTVSGNTTSKTTTQKRGFPLTYSYEQVSITSWTCNGKVQPAGQDSSGDFNPIALVVDAICVLLATLICLTIYKMVFRRKSA